MAADKQDRWLTMVDTLLHPRISTWLFTIRSKSSSMSPSLRLQHNSKDVKKFDQSVSLLFTPSPSNPIVITSPFDYNLCVFLNDSDTSRVRVPFERRQRQGYDQHAETVWITHILGKFCVPVSSRVKFHLESSNQHKGQYRLLSAHLTIHVLLVPKVDWFPRHIDAEKKDQTKTDYLDNYTVFFTLRKENIFSALWNVMIPNQSITHARSHACSTVMIDCNISQLGPIDMGRIVGPSSPKIGAPFDLIADVTVFNRRDEIVWFHSGYLWIEELPPSSFECSLLASHATDEGTVIVTLQTSQDENKEITCVTSLKVVLPTRVCCIKYHQVAWDLLERAPK